MPLRVLLALLEVFDGLGRHRATRPLLVRAGVFLLSLRHVYDAVVLELGELLLVGHRFDLLAAFFLQQEFLLHTVDRDSDDVLADFRGRGCAADGIQAAVDNDMSAIDRAGARIGTPSFFINGKLIQGAQPYPAFKAAVDEALRNAR